MNDLSGKAVLLEAIELCSQIFTDLGHQVISDKIKAIYNNPDIINLTNLYQEYEYLLSFLQEKKKRAFSFGDGNQLVMMLFYILSIKKEWNDDGRAVIIINEMPDEVTIKDNPYKNVKVIYDDDEVRDRDFDRLKILMK